MTADMKKKKKKSADMLLLENASRVFTPRDHRITLYHMRNIRGYSITLNDYIRGTFEFPRSRAVIEIN